MDAYCERTSVAFWAEPLNAVSNLAFLVAGLATILLWRDERRRHPDRPKDHPSLALAGLVTVIGVGSFLFHTFANRWSLLADVLPIAAFIYAYFALALTRFFGFGKAGAAFGTAAFFAASFIADPLFSPIFRSSAGYVPALLAMLAIGSILVALRRKAGPAVLTAGCVFFVSILFRMADEVLCSVWPYGLHFGWHILNAVTLYLLLRAAILSASGRPQRQVRS